MVNDYEFSKTVSMTLQILKTFFVFFTVLSFNKTEGQSTFKGEKHSFYNIISGYSLIQGTSKLNNRIVANNFPDLATPHYTFGINYGSVVKKRIVEMQFNNTGVFVSKGLSYSLLRSSNISFKYGRDILSKAEYTYFYPFVGYDVHTYDLMGKSVNKEQLDASKSDFDIISGLGLKWFFRRDLIGAFSNIALNAGISIPTFTGKWRQAGSQYLVGMYKLPVGFDFTGSIGF